MATVIPLFAFSVSLTCPSLDSDEQGSYRHIGVLGAAA
jgi:hypothetical protein